MSAPKLKKNTMTDQNTLPSLTTIYDNKIKTGEIREDVKQRVVLDNLDSLKSELEKPKPIISKIKTLFQNKDDDNKGVYIYGPVGCGKSFMMDLFFAELKREDKVRTHFHEFMLSVHHYIHEKREDMSLNEALPNFAKDFSKQYKVLCFDEFHVTDIADAMILKRLFEHLWDQGVVVVATSNWQTDDLYKDGLQRSLFLPFIDLLKEKVTVVGMVGAVDYRQEKLSGKKSFFWPNDKFAIAELNNIFEILAGEHEIRPVTLTVKGHKFFIPKAAGRTAYFHFDDLVSKNYAAVDYLSLADRYKTVVLESVPKLSEAGDDKTKRFMVLIDTLYEKKVQLFMCAELEVDKLYKSGLLEFEFERTVSRLKEMQSETYQELFKQDINQDAV